MATKSILPTLLGAKKAIEFTEGTFSENTFSDMVINLGLKGFDVKEKDEKGIGNPINPTEKVYLKEGEDTLTLKYGLTITGVSEVVTITSTAAIKDQLKNIIKRLRIEKEGETPVLYLIATGYAYNIYTGAAGFRNKDNSSSVKTKVTFRKNLDGKIVGDELVFENNTRMYPRAPFLKDTELIADPDAPAIKLLREEGPDQANFNTLVNLIATALKVDNSEEEFLQLNVVHEFVLTEGALVYPSELFPGKNDAAEKRYYKTLASSKTKYGLTPEKVNNALRTIDSFFSKECGIKVTPIEPTGANLRSGEILRDKKHDIFYFLEQLLTEKELTSKDNFFVFACFIRGGLFNKAS